MWKIWVNIKKLRYSSWISQYLNICETGMKNWFSFDCGINILTKENLTIYDNPLNTEHFYKITLPNCGKYMFIEAYFNSLDALEASIQKASLLFGLCLRDTEEHLSPHYLNNAWNVLQSADELSKRFKYLSWTERYQSRF